NIEAGELNGVGFPQLAHSKRTMETSSGAQLTLFNPPDQRVIHKLGELDVDTMTPLEALNQLHALKELL
ncbi:MAG: hypothetical protein PVG85_03625, partial [Deltaproteobacteria bacterium]